jgi:hypothetical protein
MFHLLGACLDNIKKHALEAEIEIMGLSLDVGQIAILIKLAEAAKNLPPENEEFSE